MLHRDVEQVARDSHDVIVIGGGVYGAMLLLEAARRGLRAVLVERDDFGARTSFNSFRIVHGGLRYLQSLDIVRLRESVRERRWLLRHFPDLVQPVSCLMPLYGQGMKRNSVLRLALWLNDVLSPDRNAGVSPGCHIPAGQVIGRAQALQRCPALPVPGLRGAALWWDACMPDSQRLVMEILRWAVACGASALNYVEATGLLAAGGRAAGTQVRDAVSGSTHELRAPLVINATGPWVRQTAGRLDRDFAGLFRPTLAWNVLLDRPPPAVGLVSVPAGSRDNASYFLQAFKGRLLLGTGHADWQGDADRATPDPAQLARMLEQVNRGMPALELERDAIVRVFAGLLPGRGQRDARLSVRPAIIGHGRQGGTQGVYSLAGVKFTTARQVAAQVLELALGTGCRAELPARPEPVSRAWWDCRPEDGAGLAACLQGLRSLVEQESVVHLDDLVLRRSTLWEHPEIIRRHADSLCELFSWDEQRRRAEIDRLATGFGHVLASPAIGN